VHEFEPDKCASLEAQISNVADEIAYNAHDLEDGLRAGLFSPVDLDELEIWQDLKAEIGWQDGSFDEIKRGEFIRELIGLMVMDAVQTSAENLSAASISTVEEIQLQSQNLVSYSPELVNKVRALKDFLFERMYRHYRLMRMQGKAERFICEIFEAYVNEPKMLPTKTQHRLADESLGQVITDYIAGMTDRYALQEWEKLHDPYRKV
jgi:dGTPase